MFLLTLPRANKSGDGSPSDRIFGHQCMSDDGVPSGGPGQGGSHFGKPHPPRSEPLFHAPWPSVALSVLIVVLYGLQSAVLTAPNALADLWFSPKELEVGHWMGLVTSLFLHGGWPHAIFNAGFALAFASPVSRLFGTNARGAVNFFTFYIVCGVLANLGFAVLPHHAGEVLVGASGAISGLAGAASRLMGRRDAGRLAPFTSPTVVGMTAAWLTSNLLVGLFGVTILTGGAGIAWQAHVAGYLAGLILIGPLVSVLRLLDYELEEPEPDIL